MNDTTTNLFDEFEGVNKAAWIDKITKDLKGKSIDMLKFNPEADLEAQAYYHVEDFTEKKQPEIGVGQMNNDWFITESIVDHDSKVSNSYILETLNNGTTGLKIILTASSDFKVLFKEVLLEYIFIHLVFDSLEQYEAFVLFIGDQKLGACNFEYSVFTKGLIEGKFELEFNHSLKAYKNRGKLNGHSFVVSGTEFGNYGASTVQELAIVLSQINEILEGAAQEDISAEAINKALAINLSINADYFVNIAKFRGIKKLIKSLFKQWGVDTITKPWVNANTGIRNITKNDRYNNVLRQTTEAMSAVIGGADAVIVEPYSDITGNEQERAARLARNLQLILKEESYFNQVIDPGAGAYYIEFLTDQLIEKAWALFMEIEAEGGYFKAIHSGFIHGFIEEQKASLITDLNEGTKTLLGVNKYQNSMEDWITPLKKASSQTKDFIGFANFELENHFEPAQS